MSLMISEEQLVASICRDSLFETVKEFWDVIIQEKPVWNWHIPFLCNELQIVAERVFEGRRKEYDLVINIPPGSTKSTIASVIFPAWVWARMPSAKMLCGSFSDTLAMELSRKSRDIIQSEKYQRLFPDIELRADQNTKCLAVGTRILMRDGTLKKIESLKEGDYVQSSDGTNLTTDRVVAIKDTGVKPVYAVVLSDGTEIIATKNHRLGCNGGWIAVRDMKIGSYLKVARRIYPQRGGLSKDNAFLLALWLANGSKSCTGFVVSTKNENLQKRLEEIAELRGWAIKIKGSLVTLSCGKKQNGDTPVNFLKSYRLYHKVTTQTIRIPKAVFRAEDEVVREFIGTYIACDGCIAKADQSAVIKISSTSRRIAADFRILLKRFGVQCRIGSEMGRYRLSDGSIRTTRLCYTVYIQRKHSIIALEGLNLYGKDSKLAELVAKKKELINSPNRRGDMDALLEVSESIEIRKIVSIFSIGKMQTFDIQTERYNAFFAEGVLSHNSFFVNTQGGSRYCMGTGGTVTGFHGHFLIVDDPLDPQRALSDLDMASANVWMDETLSQRKVDKSVTPLILIMQRLHQNDPTGARLSKRKAGKVRLVCLPAEETENIKPESCRKYYHNGLLDPRRLTKRVLKEARATLGEAGYAGQMLQNPIPRGGAMFKADLLRIETPPAKFRQLVRYWDKAGTSKGGAYTVGVLMGLDHEGRYWILDVIRVQQDAASRERTIVQTAASDGVEVKIGIEREPADSGKESAEATLKRLVGFRAEAYLARGSKELRADTFATQVNADNVRLKVGRWNKDFIEEMRFFPRSRYKDQVDAASGAFSVLDRPRIRLGVLK